MTQMTVRLGLITFREHGTCFRDKLRARKCIHLCLALKWMGRLCFMLDFHYASIFRVVIFMNGHSLYGKKCNAALRCYLCMSIRWHCCNKLLWESKMIIFSGAAVMFRSSLIWVSSTTFPRSSSKRQLLLPEFQCEPNKVVGIFALNVCKNPFHNVLVC